MIDEVAQECDTLREPKRHPDGGDAEALVETAGQLPGQKRPDEGPDVDAG